MNIENWILAHEATLRIGFFFGIFVLIALWEVVAPRRRLSVSRAVRWVNNLGLVALNTLLLRLVFPAAAVGMAALAAQQGWGLFNHLDTPYLLSLAISIIAMDFVIWLQHVMVHAIPLLWRLHRVHHADLDYDLTTGARFHPIEIILSMLIKLATVAVLGAPVLAVVIFEILLNTVATFNHGNLRLPGRLDRMLRWFVVTPDMHRVHHSVEDDETNSNFGFNLPWWDRMFGTYRGYPRGGHEGMVIGIRGFRDPKMVQRLPGMLALPFKGRITEYAINRRNWSAPADSGPTDRAPARSRPAAQNTDPVFRSTNLGKMRTSQPV